MSSAGSCLLQMEKALQRHVIGQSEAVRAVSRAIRRAGIGIRDSNGPIGSFLFAGPTGVGRTLLAKSLAIEYFGDKDAMIRLDMNDYRDEKSLSKLTEAVRCCTPHSVVLLNEIEKAHYNVQNLMLQVLRDGKLTDVVNNGLTVDLKNTIIIMTSNLGFKTYNCRDTPCDSDNDDDSDNSDSDDGSDFDWINWNKSQVDWDASQVEVKLGKELRPELLNWIDEVIVFKKLGRSEMREIVEIMVKEFSETLQAQKNVKVAVTERLKKKLVEESFEQSKRYGAKSLKRAISKVLVDNVAVGMLNGRVKDGAVTVDMDSIGNVAFFYPPTIFVSKDI